MRPPEHRLSEENETFRKHKLSLLEEGEGKFVLIQKQEICGLWDTYDAALQAATERFGPSTPFLIKRLPSFDRIYWFSLDCSLGR